MSESTKLIDISRILGVTVICPNVAAENLLAKPITIEAHFRPGAQSTVHIHPQQDESYQVLSGTMELFLDNQWQTLGPGQSIRIPKGKAHAFRNTTNEVTKTINIHDPGLRFQEWIEVLERLIQEDKITNVTGLRSIIYLSLHSLAFSNEFVPVRPPYWLIKTMARIGRTLGYKL